MSVSTIAATLRSSISGDAWHGPSLQDLLVDVSPVEAYDHPIRGAHSVVEILLHICSWIDEAASRLNGNEPSAPSAGDWPAPLGNGAIGWVRAKSRLGAASDALQSALAAFPESRLSGIVGTARDAPLGTGVTFEAMLVGLAQHNAYHGGQVALLKRAMRD